MITHKVFCFPSSVENVVPPSLMKFLFVYLGTHYFIQHDPICFLMNYSIVFARFIASVDRFAFLQKLSHGNSE